MPRRPRGLRPASADRPAKPYLPDGSLDPREWEVACSAAGVLTLAVLRDEPWFVAAQPVHVVGQGVEVEVVVRWLSTEVYEKVPARVDGYAVDVVVDGVDAAVHTVH